jgi:hypothetical protein
MTTNTPLSADELRSKIIENFKQAEKTLTEYRQYAESQRALNIEYHRARFAENFPGVPMVETGKVLVFDACETPKSLDRALAEICAAGLTPKGLIHDLENHRFIFYV